MEYKYVVRFLEDTTLNGQLYQSRRVYTLTEQEFTQIEKGIECIKVIKTTMQVRNTSMGNDEIHCSKFERIER